MGVPRAAGLPNLQVTSSARPVYNGCIQAITLDFIMFRTVICPQHWGKIPEWKEPAPGPRMMPDREGSGYNLSPPKVLWNYSALHSHPYHLLLLPMLNCPLDAFPPLVLIYSFNIFPKQKSFSSANHHKKNFFYKQDRQSDILHTVLPYNSTSLIPSLLRVLNISFQNNLFP